MKLTEQILFNFLPLYTILISFGSYLYSESRVSTVMSLINDQLMTLNRQGNRSLCNSLARKVAYIDLI